MKQVILRKGQAVVEEVPAPGVEAGGLLVRVAYSCISIGTEMSSLRGSGDPLWRRVIRDPAKVLRVLEMAASQGIRRTGSLVQGHLEAGEASGYSAAGTVLAAGAGVDDISPGERVACAGAGYASHAEIIRVPRNLLVPVPENLDMRTASTVTLGAIALQGVRRLAPTLGETFVVIGLGLLGQLTAQLLKAAGCRVIGTDLDRRRIELALEQGMDAGLHPEEGDGIEATARLTAGVGADGVVITASSPSDAIVSTAFRMCRRKGRVVLVGDVGLGLNRADLYRKELDFLVSTSYGPGRYDSAYEEQGLDYPVAYVRWTENRNMQEYLRQAAGGAIAVEPLIAAVYPVDEAGAAYQSLRGELAAAPAVLLHFPGEVETASTRRVANPRAMPGGAGTVRLALVGAGGFARGTHLPHLQALTDRYTLRAVMSRSGPNAVAAAKQFGAAYATTDLAEVLRDPEIDAVLIATRHDLHAGQALEALEAGKHVLVEKPLALHRAELEALVGFFGRAEGAGRAPVLMTGFNRRFAPIAVAVRAVTAARREPLVINYRVNAGYLPADNWVHGPEGGGRNLGEACHFYDLCAFFTGSRPTSVQATGVAKGSGYYGRRDNFSATIRFEDGSVAVLVYTAMGSREMAKERCEIFCEGTSLVIDDWRRLQVSGRAGRWPEHAVADKGHRAELEAFARVIREGGAWPMTLEEQIQATEIALRVEEALV